MNVTTEIKKGDNSTVIVDVTIPKEEVASQFEKISNEYLKKTQIKGFRKGKAPKNIVIKKFNSDIQSDTIEKLINSSVNNIITEKELKIFTMPRVLKTDEKITTGEDYHFTFDVELIPTIELSEYKGIEYNKINYFYDDSNIEDKLKEYQKSEMLIIDKESEPIAEDDIISFEYFFFLDEEDKNKKIEDIAANLGEINLKYKTADNIILQDNVIQDIIGKQVGYKAVYEDIDKSVLKNLLREEFDIVEEEDIKAAKLYIEINKVEKEELPEIDDDFAKDFDFNNLEEMKDSIRSKFEKDTNFISLITNGGAILDKIIEKSKFDIPESLTKQEMRRLASELEAGIGKEAFSYMMKQQGYISKIHEPLRREALVAIKKELIMEKIKEEVKFEVSEDDIKESIADIAKNYGITEEMAAQEIKNNNAMQGIEDNIILYKLYQYLVENASPIEEINKNIKDRFNINYEESEEGDDDIINIDGEIKEYEQGSSDEQKENDNQNE